MKTEGSKDRIHVLMNKSCKSNHHNKVTYLLNCWTYIMFINYILLFGGPVIGRILETLRNCLVSLCPGPGLGPSQKLTPIHGRKSLGVLLEGHGMILHPPLIVLYFQGWFWDNSQPKQHCSSSSWKIAKKRNQASA